MSFKVPLFELNYDKNEEDAILQTLQSKWISMGPKTLELESIFAKKLNVNHALAVTNCTAALHLAMIINDIKKGDEVICPSLTFAATANCIRYVGAIPVFADIKNYNNLTICPEDIQKKITSKTKAIIIMHYGGFACDMKHILKIAEKHNLKIIEDACHAPLSEYNGKKLGAIGDVGTFSFFSNKNISTGEGGILTTNNEDLYNKAKLLRSHGMTTMSYDRSRGHVTDYDVVELGYNYRIDDLRASLAISQLNKLKNDLVKREQVRKLYIEKLISNKNIYLPFFDYKEFSSNYIFPIILKNSTVQKRNNIRDLLAKQGIQTSVHYPAVHRFSIYKKYYRELPKTDYAADNLITLPMYSSLSDKEIEYICLNLEKHIG